MEKQKRKQEWQRYGILLGAGVILLLLWWQFWLKDQTVQNRWVLESQTEQSFVADSCRDRIQGIGLCNDDAVKSASKEYDPCTITGTMRILDAENRVVWEQELEQVTIPTLEIGQQWDLTNEEILLTDGAEYHVEIETADGEKLEHITWAFFGGERSWGSFYLVISLLLLLILTVGYSCLCGALRIPFAAVWILGSLLLAFVGMMIMVPPCVPDEELHFSSAYAISNQLLQLLPGMSGLAKRVPSGVLRMSGFDNAQYLRQFWTDWSYGNWQVEGAAGYTLVGMMPHYSYAVPAVGITLMRILGAPYQWYIIAAREMNVLLYAVLTWAAMKVYPPMKRAVIGMSLLPSVLWMVNSCSYDVWNLGFFILFACVCARLGEKEKVCPREILAALLILVVFAPIKFIYANGILLLLFIRRGSIVMKHKKAVVSALGGLVLICVIVVTASRWREIAAFLGSSGYDDRAGLDAQTSYSMMWVFRHPVSTALVYIKTLYTDGFDLFWKMFLGDQFSNGIPMMLGMGIICVFLYVMCDTARRGAFAGRRYRAAAALTAASGALLVMTSFLFIYSYRGGGIGTIRGMQGRYFMPYLICVPFLFAGQKRSEGLYTEEGALQQSRQTFAAGNRMVYFLLLLTVCSFWTRFCSVITA